ncbi:MAG: DNA polymerase [Oscillochloris sp.]|nr:DNA polymerase [Oscillochloris sp.]
MSVSEWVYGWDDTPGIVSVWANREGQALIWRRIGDRLLREQATFRHWLLAAHLDDLTSLGVALQPDDERAPLSYHALTGPAGAYRFLISARSLRTLEQTLQRGASRRLGRPIDALGDLDDYYRVGPVEQYLMASGRVYFRGLTYHDLRRMQIDLETTDLDPQRGRIFLVAVSDSAGLAMTIEAPDPADEAGLISQLCALVRARDPDVIENHNLFGFDMPFLVARAEALGVALDLGRPGAPRRIERVRDGRGYRHSLPGRELLDTLDAVRRHDFVARDMPSHTLKDAARYFGVAGPERVYLPGSEIYTTYRRDPDLVRRYALGDVAEVQALSARLLTAPFALASMVPRRFERVAWAGPAMGILEPMLLRAYLRADQAPPPPPNVRGERSGGHSGGATFLFASGVAERVVKADIASLYPSLMRAYQIGPACDRLGALLGIVGQLLSARLQHKAAARAAPPGSPEAGHHQALQAAMKLVINSAYGYLGAVSMGLFSDMRAADEVTSRGRAVLDQVINALRARGVALIEADTDGVYFAVPATYDENAERALVAEVAAELPAGINLEYEGRYRAMLSHEVKNYVLLGYDGQLIMRGVAMRSSRAEPFGEHFLRAAMRLTMLGDIAGLRGHFLATVADLQARRYTAAEVASRVRLSKSPERYRASHQREGQYEAILAAGRSEWQPGERVRYYRASGGRYRWLPDDSPHSAELNDARDYDSEHYIRVLVENYADRLRKAFRPADFDQIFRADAQLGLFDEPVEEIAPKWIR